MSGQPIDEFSIKVEVDAEGVEKGAKKAEKAVDKSVDNIKQKFQTLAETTKVWINAFASFQIAMGVAFHQFLNDADALGKKSSDIGIGVETLNALEMAVDRAGGSVSDLEKDMQSLAEETGGDAYSALMNLAAAAEEMGEAEFKTYAESLGISSSTIELTKDGTQALKNQIHYMKELGVVNEKDAKIANEYKKAIKDLWSSFRGFANVLIRMGLPTLKKFTDAGRKFLMALSQDEKFVKIFFTGLAAVITTVAIPAFMHLAAVMLANPITWLIAGLTVFAAILDDIFTWMDGGETLWGDEWDKIFGDPVKAKEDWEEFAASLQEWLPEAKELLSDLGTLFKNLANPIIALIGIFKLVGNAWDALKDGMMSGLDALGEKFKWFGEVVSNALKEFGSFTGLSAAADRGAAITGNSNSISYDKDAVNESNGGIFTTPTHAFIGEAGGEAVIPFSPGKRNRGLELLSQIAGNLLPNVSAVQALPMGGATTNNNITSDTRVNVGNVTINAADGTDAANQFMSGIESRASAWTAAANVAY